MLSRNGKILASGAIIATIIIASVLIVVLLSIPQPNNGPSGGSQELEWTWVSGNYSTGLATYGTKGVSDAANVPGGRDGSCSWTDASGNFWLFGGEGYGNESSDWGYFNDVWRFNVTDLTWTWMSGNYSVNNMGIYGTKGVPDAANVPGGRDNIASWTDVSGNFWLFGGYGFDNESNDGYLSDLWRFNVTDLKWTWISGNNTRNRPGTYGTLGVPDAANVPAGRYYSDSWKDASGNFWLFGGYGRDNESTYGSLNDVWRFNVTDLTWTWMSGNYSVDNPGFYGTMGVPDVANVPGARQEPVSWTDSNGNFWLFGGLGYNNESTADYLNDLWRFNVTDLKWTWMSGNHTRLDPGHHGTKGVPDPANLPSARGYASDGYSSDGSGNIWFFGGQGKDNTSTMGRFNDLWRLNTTDLIWTWMSGNYSVDNKGIYGTKGMASAANIPGSRDDGITWMDSNGNLWLFGGYGFDYIGAPGNSLNDLWKVAI